MLRWRLLLGTLIIAALVGLCWLDHAVRPPGLVLLPLAMLVTVLASGEMLVLADAAGARPPAWVVYVGTLLVVTAGWIAAVWPCVIGWAPPGGSVAAPAALASARAWTLFALAFGLLLAFCGEMRRYERPGGVTVHLSGAVLAIVYVGVLLGFVVQLRMAFGIAALAALVIVVKMCDTGAYATGRLMGRHKMAPVISPGKTWEGTIGGVVWGCLGSWATFTWLVPLMTPPGAPQGPWWGWIVFGIAVSVAGTLGDLAESLLKRDVGRKDSSRWMPGFGGVLDILDSILLAAPVAYACWGLMLHWR
jgi:phosphatidate cytidylyltransferase